MHLGFFGVEAQLLDIEVKIKVGVIFHRLGPYHVARLAAAATVCDLTAIELSEETSEYAWEKVNRISSFQRITLFPERDSRKAGVRDLARRLENALEKNPQDIIAVPGWSDKAGFVAIRWCARRRIPIVLMSESTTWDERRVCWKEWIKRRLVNLCAAALVGGRSQKAYLGELGMPEEYVVGGYNVVDNEYFAEKADEVRCNPSANRVRYGLPGNYFLASARFIEKKNLPRLIEAFAKYRAVSCQSDPWSLVILGDGPLRSKLCSLISELRLEDCVLLPGFKQYGELPVYYGLATVFVHASTTEQWGLVVNEAMASGLPVLVSNRCGCAADLIEEGRNGFTFEPTDVEAFAQLMSKVATPGFPLAAMGHESQRIMRNFRADCFAEGLKKAAKIALHRPRSRLGLLDGLLLHLLIAK